MKTNTTSRPACPEISAQRPKMAAYLAGAAGTAAMLGAPQAEAAVTAVSFGFGPTLTTSDGVDQNSAVVGGSFGNIAWGGYSSQSYVGWSGGGGGKFYHNPTQLPHAIGSAKFLAASTVVGAGGNGSLGRAVFASTYESQNAYTTDQLDKYIGFRTSTNHYGWANVSWVASTKVLTIHSAFVESEVGNSITISPVPEPSRALLAIAGLGGMALRRRRKQAA
jgi:hypothetical protein